MKLAFAAEVRELDRATIEQFGVPGIALMENAGRATAVLIDDLLTTRGVRSGRIRIFCGGGNNGGDGYVIARHLLNRDHVVDVFLLSEQDKITGDALTNLEVLEAMGNVVGVYPLAALSDEEFRGTMMRALMGPCDVIVDAMLGTGLNSAVRGRYRSVIEMANAHPAPTVAVDIPSGLSADTGQPLGTATRAELTATYGAAKPGLFLDPGRAYCGHVETVDIGFPRQVLSNSLRGLALNPELVAPFLAPRTANVHKGTFGHVLVLAGSRGSSGAAIMTGTGALRAGAGLVTVGTESELFDTIPTVSWELMARPALASPFDDDARTGLQALLEGKQVVAVGPGCGDTDATADLLAALAADWDGPLVIDADGLNALARRSDLLELFDERTVLTPHPGEMARLVDGSTAEVMKDQLGCARDFAQEHGVVVVLKTSSTVVAHPDGSYAINTSGTPGMASAGMGDVLTGVIAGLLAQDLDPFDAACVGVHVHGLAGERAARETGQRGLTARYLLNALPMVLRDLEATATP